jgi:hypothetical protein
MKLLLFILFSFRTLSFDVKDLTEDIYKQTLINKHIFIIACVNDDDQCTKFYKDFKKEWL